MAEAACGWAGCGSGSEATLDNRPLCRSHFYDMAVKRIDEYRAGLQQIDSAGGDRTAILKFLSEVISRTTNLVASVKFLSPRQREQFFELSLSAADLYKRVQRSPRVKRNMPILIYREMDFTRKQELTNTVDVSKRGACIATSSLWEIGEKIWIEKPTRKLPTLARVAWLKKSEASQFLLGLEILDCEDFWGLATA